MHKRSGAEHLRRRYFGSAPHPGRPSGSRIPLRKKLERAYREGRELKLSKSDVEEVWRMVVESQVSGNAVSGSGDKRMRVIERTAREIRERAEMIERMVEDDGGGE